MEKNIVQRRSLLSNLFLISILVYPMQLGCGNRLLTEVGNLEKQSNWAIVYETYGEIYSYSIAAKESTLIGKIENSRWDEGYYRPILLPNQERLIVASDFKEDSYETKYWILKLLDLRGRVIENLLTLNRVNNLAWSPKREKIAIAGSEKPGVPLPPEADDLKHFRLTFQNDSLFIFDLNSRQLEKIVDSNVYQVSSTQAWSPDGKKLLYETVDKKIMSYDFETKTSQKLVDDATNASWSPTGAWIAFQVDHEDPSQQHYYLLKPDGTNRKLFFNNWKVEENWFRSQAIYHASRPVSWSPDGRFILFARRVTTIRDETFDNLYLMRVSGSSSVKLGRAEGYFSDANWVYLHPHKKSGTKSENQNQVPGTAEGDGR